MGRHITVDGGLGGYYVDFSFKPEAPSWPAAWFRPGGLEFHVAVAQWGLGCFERHLDGQGEEWLRAARAAADQLLADQLREGPLAGGWAHTFALRHSYHLPPPWLSGMAQGEGASLLVRIALASGEDAYAEAARRALSPMRVASSVGGVAARLDGGFFCEEYPTNPPSFVLNGAIFGLWGIRDVAVALGDEAAGELFDDGRATLARSLSRWDTGYWSRYDLFPHPITNVASSAYHQLHIDQLEAMHLVTGDDPFRATAERFRAYAASRANAARAFASKACFRLLVPRNHRLAHRLPWAHARRS